jgi:hypothetical protein
MLGTIMSTVRILMVFPAALAPLFASQQMKTVAGEFVAVLPTDGHLTLQHPSTWHNLLKPFRYLVPSETVMLRGEPWISQ